MAEPKKETVRIALPPRPEAAGAASAEKRETARIVLPSRTPVSPIRRLPPKITPLPASGTSQAESTVLPRRPPVVSPNVSPLLQPLPKPPGVQTNDSGAPLRPIRPARDESSAAPSIQPGPKKETARIGVLPRPTPTAAPAINMTKTQPLLIQPAASTPVTPVVITSRPLAPVEAIPRPLCWALFGISAAIFLIQIWNYVVS
ncbi:MAG TPA: hypothetical protein VF511_11810 [Chthoniobacterales bacterium]